MDSSQEVHKCRPRGKVLLNVKLGQYKLETTLEQFKAFIHAKKNLFLSLLDFPGKLHFGEVAFL